MTGIFSEESCGFPILKSCECLEPEVFFVIQRNTPCHADAWQGVIVYSAGAVVSLGTEVGGSVVSVGADPSSEGCSRR